MIGVYDMIDQAISEALGVPVEEYIDVIENCSPMLDARPVVAFSITDDVICSAFINALIKFVIPCVVYVSCDDEIYPAVPRPTVVLCSEREEIYPIEPREFCKETICVPLRNVTR